MIVEYNPPRSIPCRVGMKYIFLAGSIDSNSDGWRKKTISDLGEQYGMNMDVNLAIINPARDDWDVLSPNVAENPEFYKQVSWEFEGMDKADYIIMNFLPNSLSPISLMEFGLHARSNILVCCPSTFYRYGNVQMVCNRFGIPLYDNMGHLLVDLFQVL